VSEAKSLKQTLKDKDNELKNVKSDCAQALLGKEKTLQIRLKELSNEVSDLQFLT